MSVDGDEYLQVYTITAAAVARAIASCRPSGPLQDTQKVVVSAKYSAEQRDVQVTVEDTGRAINIKEIAAAFQQAFPEGCACLCNTLHVSSTGMHESVTREYVVKAGLPSGNPAVTESLPVSKQCEHGPYSGSKVTFRVPEVACAPLKALDAITAALEPTTMIAPPVAINLSTSGFEALMQSAGMMPLPEKVKYHLEPLPSSLTPLQRMEKGIAAFFGIETEIASEPELAGLTVQDVPVPRAQGEQGEAAQEHTGNSQVSAFLSGSISVAHTAADQDSTNPTPSSVSAKAMQWTACAAVILKGTPDEDTAWSADQGGSPARSRLMLFENFAQLQRPQQLLLNALSRATFWQSFGISVQSLSPQADGITQIVFSPDSAHLMGRIQLIAVHLVCADVKAKTSAKTGMLAGLSATLEAKLVRRAIEGALAAVKHAHPLELLSLFEQRMSCLGHIARSLAAITQRSTNADFQERVCAHAGCDLNDLSEVIQEKLEQVVQAHMRREG